MNPDSSLLLEIGMPFRRRGEHLLVEAQALNGLRLWATHFSQVTVCANELPADSADDSSVVWADPSALLAEGRIRLEPLPWAYHPRDHLRHRAEVRRRFARLVSEHRYLCFSTLGVFGAWGNFAAAQARSQRRPYSLWLDWVLHAMAPARHGTLRRRLIHEVTVRLTKRETNRSIRACALGLFHGQTVYDAYAPICRQPQLVHDIHIGPEDGIGPGALETKLAEQRSRNTLRIGYVGRVHPMKAPFQWIEAVEAAVEALGPDRVHATWLGDGPLLDAARARVRERGLEKSIVFGGFTSDRSAVLAFLQERDVLLFCHITPESPRCLPESLVSATGIVGYDSAFARELVGSRGGAVLGPIGLPRTLAAHLIELADDREQLVALTEAAASSRALYNDEAVFAHRSRLIKRYLA